MKTKTLLLGFIILSGLMTSCDHETIRASNDISTQEFSFRDYSSLEVSDDFNVYVRFSDTEEHIEIEANENLLDKVNVTKTNNTLKVKIDDHLWVRGNTTLNAFITTKNISKFRISGDSSVELESLLTSDNVSLTLLGDSRFLGEIDALELNIDAKGDSDIDLIGRADKIDADLSGDSTFKDYGLISEDLRIELSGDSDAYLTVTNTIDIEARGDSKLNYKGNADIIYQRLTGDSKIRKKD